MTKSKGRKKKAGKKIWFLGGTLLGILFTVCLLGAGYLLFSPAVLIETKKSVYLRRNIGISELGDVLNGSGISSDRFKIKIVSILLRADSLRKGHYIIRPEWDAITLVRNLNRGLQDPVKVTILQSRTLDRMVEKTGKQMAFGMVDLNAYLRLDSFLSKNNLDTFKLPGLFLPTVHEAYWTESPERFVQRLLTHYKTFWSIRDKKAKAIGLNRYSATALASIVEAETWLDQEKPSIAAVYLNRIKKGMRLQADPTVIFASRQFDAKRVSGEMLDKDSPYNTYVYSGLPPGPINNPSVASIDATLRPDTHEYLYFCAKEDFSGGHVFSTTYEEHKKNARKYIQALNKRGIH
jgi:UPF0755 protein